MNAPVQVEPVCRHARAVRRWVTIVVNRAEARGETRTLMEAVPAGLACPIRCAADFAGWDAVVHYTGSPIRRTIELIKRQGLPRTGA